MGKKIHRISNFSNDQEDVQNQDDTCDEQIRIIAEDSNNSNEQIEIELNYEQFMRHRKNKGKNSNVVLRLQKEQENGKNYKKKEKPKKKKKQHQQIDTKDIVDIVIIVLLVLILGISLFRVVLQVQIQYKNAQQLYQSNKKDHKGISEHGNVNQPSLNQNSSNKQKTQKQPQIPIVLTPLCQLHIDTLLQQHGQLYDFKLPYEYMSQKSRVNSFVEVKNTKINREKYAQAIKLLSVVHRIDQNGTLRVENDPCEDSDEKIQRLQKTITSQYERWNEKYQIGQYHSRQLPFCIIVNSYNNAKNGLIYRNIDSILQQNYTNYHVVYTDDHSTDLTGSKVRAYLQQKNIPIEKFNVTININKKGMMENIFFAIHKGCSDGQIAVMLDGDDSLIGTNVLALINAVYQEEKSALVWGNFLSIFGNGQASLGFSRDYSEAQKKDSSFRKLKSFISSHLKTFFVDVFKRIKIQDLQGNDGKFFGGASDTAMMIPMIEMTNSRFRYLPEVLYEYRYDTGQTGNIVNKVPQRQALKKIFNSQPYERLKDFSFVQNAIQNAMDIQTAQEQAKTDQNTQTYHTQNISQMKIPENLADDVTK